MWKIIENYWQNNLQNVGILRDFTSAGCCVDFYRNLEDGRMKLFVDKCSSDPKKPVYYSVSLIREETKTIQLYS